MRRLALVAALVAAFVGVPAGAGAFPNGRATSADLAPIYMPANSASLSGPAAAAWNTMRECAVAQGADLYPTPSGWHPAATAYRTLGAQRALWARYLNRTGALAAVPGYSNHGWGVAVDLAAPRMRAWVDQHGARFGWRKTEAFSEWWHVNYVGGFHRPNPGTSLRFPNLRKGSGGACQKAAVKEVERRLHVRQDGEYGNHVVNRVRVFQRRHRLPVTGRVESRTWLELRGAGRGLSHRRNARVVAANLPGQRAPMAGQDVRADQGLLNARFGELRRPRYRVKVDGLTGPAFTTAVRRFQVLADRHGAHLHVTGRVDDATYARLLKPFVHVAQEVRVTQEGATLVARFEGYSSRPYRDAVGVWTIGYGHTGPDVFRLSPLPQPAGLRLLWRELDQFAVGVTHVVHVRVGSRQFNALVSFSYNVGLGALQSSTLLRDLNAGHYAAAANQFGAWDRAGGRVLLGLHRRRVAECRMFARGSSAQVRRRVHCR